MEIIHKRENGNLRVQLVNEEPSRTQQQFRDECDINNIMKQYKATGSITHVNNRNQGVYADLVNLPDYKEQLENVIAARQLFNDLPAALRKRFSNDPQELIDFLSDSNNRDEAIKLGLIDSPKNANDLTNANMDTTNPQKTKPQSKKNPVAPPPTDDEA